MLKKSQFKVLLFGNGKPGIEAAKILKKGGFNFLVIPDPGDNEKRKPGDSLYSYCLKKDMHFIKPDSFSNEGFLKIIKSLKPDIILSVQCRRILKPELLALVKGRAFNVHFSDLPRSRGCYPLIWHLLSGDEYAGVTLHKIDNGIDTGCVIDNVRKKITVSDTSKSLYHWCTQMVKPLMEKNISRLLAGKYRCVKQDSKKATYYSRSSINFKEVYIDWNKSSFEVSRFIQAFAFPPFQYAKTRLGKSNVEIKSVKSFKKSAVKNPAGAVISKNSKRVTVQTGDGTVTVEAGSMSKIKKGSMFE